MTTLEDVTVLDEGVTVDKAELRDHLRLIGRALRTLQTRVNELEAEVARLHHAAEQARAVTAAEAARRIVAEQEIQRLRPFEAVSAQHQTSALELQRALEELRATKVLRWSAQPRRWYAAARRLVDAQP